MTQDLPTFNTTFWIEGDGLDPEEFTQVSGIQPTQVTKKGQSSPYPAARAIGKISPTTSWKVSFRCQSSNMDQVVQKMLTLLWKKRDFIQEYVQNRSDTMAGLRSTPTIREHCSQPVYELSIDTIKKLAYLGCNFSMDDVYDYRPPLPLPPYYEGWTEDNPFLTARLWVGGEGFDLVAWEAGVKELAMEPMDNGKGNSGHFSPEQGEQLPAGPSWHLMRTSRYYSTDAAIQEVLTPLWARREVIKSYFTERPGVMGSVRCLVEIVEDRTVYELLLPTLQQLAFLGWTVRLDVHNYRQEDDE